MIPPAACMTALEAFADLASPRTQPPHVTAKFCTQVTSWERYILVAIMQLESASRQHVQALMHV